MFSKRDGDMLDESAARSFRLRRAYWWEGVIGTLFMAAMGVGSVMAALFNLDESFHQPILTAVVFAIAWGGFAMLGIYIIAAYYRERLFFFADAVVQKTVFREKRIPHEQVRTIKWGPGRDRIALHADTEKIIIHLSNFYPDEQDEVITYLRQQFPESIQESWTSFAKAQAEKQKPQLFSGMLIGSLLFVSSAGFAYASMSGLGEVWRFVGLLSAVAGAVYFWRAWMVFSSRSKPR